MCILILKKKGFLFPIEATVKQCMNANPHGFSMSYNVDGKVVTYKTLNAADFMAEYKRVTSSLDHNTTAMMLHMRIATHGSVKETNCHGWKGNILGTEMAFAHNGILSIPNRGDMTDSETFLHDYLEPCRSIGEFVSTVADNIGTSKFGFLDGEGNVVHFGNFITERGVLYSNGSYRHDPYSRRMADPRLWLTRV